MTGNLGTRFPRNLQTQPKYFVGVPLFDKMCIEKDQINNFLPQDIYYYVHIMSSLTEIRDKRVISGKYFGWA